MSVIDGELFHVQARYPSRYKGIRERFEEDAKRIPNIVKGFQGSGAEAVKVERLLYVREPVADLSYGDPALLSKDW